MRLALQVAKDDRMAILRGQAGELLVEDFGDFAIGGGTIIDDRRDCGRIGSNRLRRAASDRARIATRVATP